MLGLLLLLVGCDDAWKDDIATYRVLTCRYEAVCADSTQGLDCDAYADQLVVRADPCLNYDDYYMDACLTQLRDLVEGVEEEGTCPESRDDAAPACTQAFSPLAGGDCLPQG